MTPLDFFIFVYAFVSFFYIVYRYFFATIDLEEEYDKFRPSVSIVIPCYNEEKNYLRKCVTSACKADYLKKEVIVVDDGSTNDCWRAVKDLKKRFKFKVFRFPKNMGKRHAVAKGIREAKGEIIITTDSDTIIPSGRSIRELVNPFQDENVGSVSGNIFVKNKKKNLLTKIMDARYWLAFNMEKSSQNPYNSVTCCSGPFSAHRKKYLMKFLNEWNNQKFLGISCTYGDDRGLTTFMLRDGYKVKFIKKARALTYVPESLRKFIKQQLRWKKSYCRESWYLIKFLHKRNILMIFEFYLFWFVFIMGFASKFLALYFTILNPLYFSKYIVMVLMVSMIHYLYCFLKSPGMRGIYGILYGFLHEFLISWLFFISVINLRDQRWGTR